jgi:hypothetical protein
LTYTGLEIKEERKGGNDQRGEKREKKKKIMLTAK